jgi:hypothetical protein
MPRIGSRGNVSQATKSITKFGAPKAAVAEAYLRAVKTGTFGGYLNVGLELGAAGPVAPGVVSEVLSLDIQNQPYPPHPPPS